MGDHVFLVRYGLARHVGLFASEWEDHPRGQTVVVRSHRGTELGEVLLRREGPSSGGPGSRVLRVACAEDLDRARRLEEVRGGWLSACERVFRDGVWPLEVVDLEPLLDDRCAVLHYLGPHRLDVGPLRGILREAHGLDVVFEPVGPDVEFGESSEVETDSGGCGAGGCSAGGEAGSSCGSCSGCPAKSLASVRARAGTRSKLPL